MQIKDPKLRFLVLALGTIVQIAGHVLYLKNFLIDPVYSLLLTISGYIIILILCARWLFKKRSTTSVILEASGSPISKKIHFYSTKERIISGIILLLTTVAFFAHTINVLSSSRRTTLKGSAQALKELYADYQETHGVFSIVQLSGTRWFEVWALAILDKKKVYPLLKGISRDSWYHPVIVECIEKGWALPFAEIIDRSTENITRFKGTSCALEFDLEVPPRIPWVNIDEIIVVVNSYRPLPKYEPSVPRPLGKVHVYYVEIDNPEISRSNIFRAEYIFYNGKSERIGNVRLMPNKPEMFVVRINAKTPGIYDFGVHLLVRHKELKERIIVVNSAKFLFDRR